MKINGVSSSSMQAITNQVPPSETILLLSYGHSTEYGRALLLLNSILEYWIPDGISRSIRIATDNPDYFVKQLPHCVLDFELLTPDTLTQLRGPLNFIHLIKIGVLMSALRSCGGNVLYLDSDTFVLSNPSKIFQSIQPDQVIFHTKEYSFADMRSIPEAKHKLLGELLVNLDFWKVSSRGKALAELFSWNAGVIGLHQAHAALLQDIIALAENFFERSGHHASEQYAFSIIMQSNFDVKSCEDIVFHYWTGSLKLAVDSVLEGSNFVATSQNLSDPRFVNVEPAYQKLKHFFMGIQDRRRSISALRAGQYYDAVLAAMRYLLNVRFRDIMFFKDLLHVIRMKIYSKLNYPFKR